jgi:hypothetical protein
VDGGAGFVFFTKHSPIPAIVFAHRHQRSNLASPPEREILGFDLVRSCPPSLEGGIAMPRATLFEPSDNEKNLEAGADRRPAIIRWIAPALTVLFVAAAVLVVSFVAAVAGLL